MVMRSNSNDSANRVQTNASRATLRELNSGPFWSEAKQLDVMASETHSDVEYAENYGSTSVPAKQDEDEQQQGQQQKDSGGGDGGPGGAGAGSQGEEGEQPQGDAAEAIVLYLNGSRSHPVIISMGDRRHRLIGLEEGDVANHRLKDDRQQWLMSKDGTYISTRNDKVLRIALVDPKDTGEPKPSSQQQQQPTATQQAANGGSSSSGTGQQGQGKQQKKYGQKSAKDDNKSSKININQDKKATTIQHNDGHSQQTGDDSTAYHGDKTKSVQATADHAHLRTGGNRIFTDKGGCWSTVPIQQKKDGYCKT
jgi:phage gp45-like